MMPTFAVLAFLAIVVGSAIEILPTLIVHSYVRTNVKVEPYTALELAGRDLYVREGCYLCHSQMIRQLSADVLRYGPASRPEESMYDRPFQWGSKRIGPDLARVGGKYPDLWHYRHMMEPRSVTPNSIMPNYTWLFDNKTDFAILNKKFEIMKSLGVPYSDAQVVNAPNDARTQAAAIAQGLAKDLPSDVNVQALQDREIIALIAYLQRLGKNPDVLNQPASTQEVMQ
jgi:cytochrome c oxidase cbb3-type subunit I/II